MSKLLIVGQAPNSKGPGDPLMGNIAIKLSAMLDLSMDEYKNKTSRCNLIDYYPGKSGKGDEFPEEEARERALEIFLKCSKNQRDVLLLGKNVAKAFGFNSAKFLDTYEMGGCRYHIFPHPSGVNRWWNDPENKRLGYEFGKKLAAGTK